MVHRRVMPHHLETVMATSHFDTLKMAERLEAVGVPVGQARMHALVLSDALDEAIGTEDVSVAERSADKAEVSAELCELRIAIEKLDAKIDKVESTLDAKMMATAAELKSELIRWVLTVSVSVGALQLALISGLLLKLVH